MAFPEGDGIDCAARIGSWRLGDVPPESGRRISQKRPLAIRWLFDGRNKKGPETWPIF